MKIHRTVLAGLVAGIAALAVSSCAYDPYYSGGASYSSDGGGYGDGYGYGGSNFSTSVFVSTGNTRWGYDPYAGAYYDYTRRAYYDPYLYGYYPVGYRPRYVVGSPHPHGWHRGNAYCPPPSRIHNHNLSNYQNRGERYRGLGQSWSRDVRVTTPGHSQNQRPDFNRDPRSNGGRGQWNGSAQGQRPSNGGRGGSQGGVFGNGIRGDRGNHSQGTSPYRGDRNNDRSNNRGGSFGGRNTSVTIPQPARPPGDFSSGRDRGRSPEMGGQRRPSGPQTQPNFPNRGGDRSQMMGGGRRGNIPQSQPNIPSQRPSAPTPPAMNPNRGQGGGGGGFDRGGDRGFNRGGGGGGPAREGNGGGRGGRGVRGLGEG